jgi:hypothetical protein
MNTLMDFRLYPAQDLVNDLTYDPHPKGTKGMLLFEDLARERRREAEQDACDQRLARQASAGRRWERVSAWAARRADRNRELV